MERKIGEIFKYNGEWYQCIVGIGCENCTFSERKCYKFTDNNDPIGECCADRRKDNKDVIFKKLEKVGEPYSCNYYGDNRLIMMQEYNLFNLDDVTNEDKIPMYITDYKHKRIAIEIKETKEDMEEREYSEEEFKNNPRFQNHKPIEQVINMKKVKPFSLELAKQGKPVCTRDGRNARIICFDRKDIKPIVALVTFINGTSVIEKALYYFEDGYHLSKNDNNIYDLMMLPEKKEGWINIYKKSNDECYFAHIYDTKALAEIGKNAGCIATVRIEWEE